MKRKNLLIGLVAIFSLAFAAPVFSQARVQVIHNSADAAAEVVDVWLNDQLLIDDFAFRTASPFIDAPAGVDFDVTIQPANSTDTTNGLARFTYNLTDGETYVLVANGIVIPTGYNPPTPFDIYVYGMGRESAMMPGNTDVLVFHGSTDAPIVDVVEVLAGAGTIVNDLDYSDFAGYLELPTADYSLQIRDESGTTTVAQFAAPLATLGLTDYALTIVASGFLNPANNNNGPAFGLWVALPTGGSLVQLPSEPISTARVQVIHNSADAAAAVVDVWLNDQLLIDDFAFRTASPFIDAPAGVDFDVTIQPANSTDTTNGLARFTYNLEGGSKYILVANGIVIPTGYNPPTPFNIYVYDMGRESAMMQGNTDVLVFHGSTDAPIVDVVEVLAGAGTIVNDLDYSDFAGYLELPTADYSIQIRDESGTTTVAQFAAPLATLGLTNYALAVVASGFLNPANNNNGPAFGLWVALPEGGALVALPVVPISTARIQVIHNSADLAAQTVDVWLNDQLAIDNFQFRTATPFIDAPAGVDFDVTIQPANSTDTTNGLARFTYNLQGGSKYMLVANGIVSPTGYDPTTPFDIYVYDLAREMAMTSSNTDVLVFHGSTDAPVVDVVEVEQGAGTVIDDLAYGEFEGYLELPTADYVLEIRDASGTNTLATFSAPLATLGLNGAALSVLASGFLNPDNNSDGPAFGLFVALPQGGQLIALPLVNPAETARVQVIHNSADAAAAVVDVWLNDQLLIDDFAFRTASPFVDAPAGVDFDVTIQPANSTDTTNGLARFTYNLAAGSTYVLVANGIVVPTGYNPPTPFNIYVYDMGRESAMMQGNTDVLVFHGSTDAPMVDVVEVEQGAGTIVDDLEYAEYAGYLELPTANYALQIRDASGSVTVAEFDAPLQSLGLQGQALVILASGFLDPLVNNNGAAFGLWVALPSGGQLVELQNTTSVGELDKSKVSSLKVYPNPARETINVEYVNENSVNTMVEIRSLTGSMISSQALVSSQSFNSRSIYVGNLPVGMYILTVKTGDSITSMKFSKIN